MIHSLLHELPFYQEIIISDDRSKKYDYVCAVGALNEREEYGTPRNLSSEKKTVEQLHLSLIIYNLAPRRQGI
jgi:hypothetical protein